MGRLSMVLVTDDARPGSRELQLCAGASEGGDSRRIVGLRVGWGGRPANFASFEQDQASMRFAYLANVCILVPIAGMTLLGWSDAAQGRFSESPGWRVLVGALWTGILVLSLLGLRAPLIFSPVLVLQLIYKSLWLLMYAAPRWLSGRGDQVPPGIAVSFVVIVVVWPWLIPWKHLFAA